MKTKPDITDQLTDQNKISFRGAYTQVLLQPGDMIFRFCSHTQAKYSDCWTNKETLKLIFQSYHERNAENPFGNKKIQVRAQAFNVLAVAKSWSSLEYLLAAEVKKDLIAYKGQIEKQSFFQDVEADAGLRKVILYGGGTQYVIPRIKHYARKKDYIAIHQYLHDVELVKFIESSWYKRLVTGGHFL